MRKQMVSKYARCILLAVVLITSGTSTVFAETSSSPNYQMTESEFSGMSNKQNCSGQYCSKASIGDMSAGSSSSANSSAEFGPVKEGEPILDVIVDSGESNLGVFTTEQTASKAMTVRVRNYLSDGYTLQVVGTPPKYGSHTLAALSTPTSATPGVEQFGINAVANTAPTVGEDPLQVLTSQVNLGMVNENYRTPNKFKYSSGDEVARSDSKSGTAKYTISMIMNVSNATPSGQYTGDFSVVVVPVY